jgi:UDP-N-acetyl-2-amino-2-deoxyglucuronate dehydrogenase
MKATLSFGLIGAGNIARTHAAAIRAGERARLVAVAGGPAAAELAEAEGARHHQDAAALLADPAVDAVILCTPSGIRRDYTVAAAAAGKHVLVEKPIEVSVARAREMIAACARAGVTLGVVFQSRFKPHPQAVRDVVARGALGDMVLGSMAVKWLREAAYYRSADWRGTWAFDGGGPLINQAIHNVDMLLWLMGDVESVRATATNRLHHDIEVEDTVVAQLEFASGALGVIEATTAAYPGSPRRLELHGTAGTITLLDDEVGEWDLRDGTPAPGREVSAAAAFAHASHVMSDHRWHQLQIEDFVDAVASGRSPGVDGREGLRSLALVRAVYDAARTGEAVRVERTDG